MATLTKQARETIKTWSLDYGFTIVGYIRHHFQSGTWGGDRCGCPDDRCIGYHHDNEDDCGCLPVLLAQYAEGLANE